MGTALAKGAIDAFLSGEPFPALAVEQGYGRILSSSLLRRIGGDDQCRDAGHPGDDRKTPGQGAETGRCPCPGHGSSEARSAWLQRAETFGTPMRVLERAAPNMELAWTMDEDFIRRAKALGERMQALGVIDRQPDYDGLFDLRFVAKAEHELRP